MKASVLTIRAPPGGRSPRFVLSAAGFMATRTSGSSPGVWMSFDEKLIWKPLTPGSEPAGARISAGKSGSVLMSLPKTAAVRVNCVPVSCMPSPESPAKRIVTRSSSWISSLLLGGGLGGHAVGGSLVVAGGHVPLALKTRLRGRQILRRAPENAGRLTNAQMAWIVTVPTRRAVSRIHCIRLAFPNSGNALGMRHRNPSAAPPRPVTVTRPRRGTTGCCDPYRSECVRSTTAGLRKS